MIIACTYSMLAASSPKFEGSRSSLILLLSSVKGGWKAARCRFNGRDPPFLGNEQRRLLIHPTESVYVYTHNNMVNSYDRRLRDLVIEVSVGSEL